MLSFNIQFESRKDLSTAKERLSSGKPEHLLIQVFCGLPDETYIQTLIGDISADFPGATILGTTTAGEILDDKSLDRSTVINFTQFQETGIRVAMVDQNDDLYAAGLQLGEQICTSDTKVAIIFGCGIKEGGAINGEPLLAGFQKAAPEVLIAGAQAGDNGLAQNTFVFTQDGYTNKGVVAASLSGSCLRATNRFNLSWVPLGKKMTITDATGTCIHTIDGKPAKEIYAHYLGEGVSERLPQSAAEFPLMVQRHGVQLARHANRVLDDGSLDFMAPFNTGEKVQFAFCHTGLVVDSARRLYNEFAPHAHDAFFIYSCLSRKWVLGEDSKLEITPLAALGPTAGFFSYGEYYNNKGENMFLSQTMTILALSENGGGRQKEIERLSQPAELLDKGTKHVQDLQALHHLVETSASEREALIEELRAALSEIKTLRGFIPICASCKSIRDDSGYWKAIEQYLQDRTQAKLSHSLCPECVKSLYPDIHEKIASEKQEDGVGRFQ